MLRKWLVSFATLMGLCGSSLAADDPPLLQIGGGVFNVLRTRWCGQFQLEYKFRPPVYKLRPFVGIFTTTQLSTYIYGGVGYDVFIGKYFVVTPSFAPGIYFQGHGKNLWFPLEFRSSIEGAVVFCGGYRIGGQFYHISNASIGHKNPGVEAVLGFISIPLGK